MQPQQQLFGKIADPLGDPADMTGAGQHRHRAHQQDRRQLMADPLRAVIRDRAQLGVQTGLCFDHDLVHVDHVRLPVVVGPERRTVETGGEDTGGGGPQRGEPAALRLTVVDPAAVAPGVARRLADLDEVRRPIARAGMNRRTLRDKTAEASFGRRPEGRTQNRWVFIPYRNRRFFVSSDQPTNDSRAPSDNDAEP